MLDPQQRQRERAIFWQGFAAGFLFTVVWIILACIFLGAIR